MSTKSDLALVIDRASYIENLLDQVISGYCAPADRSPMFFWTVVLDSSIMPLGSKVKLASIIAQQLNARLNGNSIHEVLSLRNAFAHHKTTAHPVLMVGKTPAESKLHFELQVIRNSGKVERITRSDALEKFNTHFEIVRASLVALVKKIEELDSPQENPSPAD